MNSIRIYVSTKDSRCHQLKIWCQGLMYFKSEGVVFVDGRGAIQGAITNRQKEFHTTAVPVLFTYYFVTYLF